MYWAGLGKTDVQERQGNSGLACGSATEQS